jgi:Icc-related predicted phosphoesterase
VKTPSTILAPVFAALTLLFACASDPAPRSSEPVDAPPVVDEAPREDPFAVPSTLDEIAARYEFKCPVPFFELDTPGTRSVGPWTFRVLGSTIVKEGGAFQGPLVIGVIGAPKDPTEATRMNVRRAMSAFEDAGAHIVVVNGDLAEDNEITLVMTMLAEEIRLPLFVHAGNIEWAGNFTQAVVKASEKHDHIVNMNWHRHVDLGGIHLVSMPGYWNPKYTRVGACRYLETDLDALRGHLTTLKATGERVIVTSHAPPRGNGARALDLAFDAGNVGDPRFQRILIEEGVRYGLFSHILEAGGRAVDDLEAEKDLKLPMRAPTERLYINVGSASAYPWTMLDGKAKKGLAGIFTLDEQGKARVTFLELDKIKPAKKATTPAQKKSAPSKKARGR